LFLFTFEKKIVSDYCLTMKRLTKISKKIISTSLSLSLALCLIFSSLLTYTVDYFVKSDNSESIVFATQLNQGFIHQTPISKNKILAESIDIEEEDDIELKKSLSFLLSRHLRILWNYSHTEENTSTYVAILDTFISPSKEETYIEFCSLKIPS